MRTTLATPACAESVPPLLPPAARALLVASDPDAALHIGDLLADIDEPAVALDWVPTGAAALAALARGTVDVILLDDRLGARDGLDAIRAIRAVGHDLPVLALTEAANPAAERAAFAAGASDCLPASELSPHLLSRALRHALAQARLTARLRASDARFRALVQHATDVVTIIDATGAVTYQSPSIAGTLGHDPDALLGTSAFDLVHPEDLPAAGAAFARLLDDPAAIVTLVVRARHADGSYRQMEVTATNLLAEPGVGGLVASMRDISARKAAEEALRASERNHRLLMEQAADGIYLTDDTGRLLDANARGCALLGYARDELLGLSIRDLHPPGESADDEVAGAALLSGQTLTRERLLRRKDGSLVAVEVSSRLLPDGRLQGIVRDITERKAAAEALQQSAESFETLFHAASEGILIAEEGRVIAANPTFAALYGCPPEEVIGRTALELTAPEFRALARAHIADHYDRPYESALLRPDGTIVPIEVAGRPIRYRGRPARLSTVRDITERVRAEAALRESEARFRALVQHASDIFTILEADGTIRYESPAVRRVLGYTPEELVGTDAFALIHPDDLSAVLASFAAAQDIPGVAPAVTFRMRHRDGSWRHLEAVGNNLLHEPGVRGIVVNSRDVTERHEAEAALRESEARLAEAQRLAGLGSWEYDVGTARFTCSAEVYRILGRVPGEYASDGADYLAGIHPDDRDTVRHALEQVWEGERAHSIEHRIVRPDGAVRIVEVRAEIVPGDDGHPRLYRGTILDITERKALEELLTHQAFHDALTGLPNRALFADRLAHALARVEARGDGCAVLFLDLDRFKDINDTLGHDIGDRLLVAVAERLRPILAADQTLARLGGDEFTILLEDLPEAGAAVAVAERVLVAFERPFVVGDHHLSVATSIGIVVSQAGHERPEDLLRDADIAMYRAKGAGKGCYALFDAEMQRQLLERVTLEQDLWRAVAYKEFVLHYQPVVDLASGQVVEAEALVRWQHPTRGLLPPAVFIPPAEETGLIHPLGRWVIREACRQARAWRDAGHPLTVAVNLTAHEFGGPALVADVAAALREADLDPCHLRLEITESVAMHDAEATIAGLAALRALGVRVAIDDFGTGYSSLAYLQRLPVDTLKIDRSFVRDLGPDSASLTICRSVILLAHALGLRVTAEGIETDAQAARLRDLGCDHGQGYHFARPAPAAELAACLAKD